MKKQLFYAASVALMFVACSEPLQEAAEINPQIEPEISETPITFYARDRYKENPDGTYGIYYTDQEYNYRYNLEIAPDIRPKR